MLRYFRLYCADPATFPASDKLKKRSGDLIVLENSLFIQLWDLLNISEFVLLPLP